MDLKGNFHVTTSKFTGVPGTQPVCYKFPLRETGKSCAAKRWKISFTFLYSESELTVAITIVMNSQPHASMIVCFNAIKI